MARNSKSRTAKRGAAKVRAKKTARSTPDKSTLPISKDMNTSETHNAPDQTNILLERYGLGDTPTAQLRRKILDGYEAWPIEARGHFGAKRFKKPLGEEVESREVAASLRRRLGLHSVLLGEIDEKAGTMTVEGGHGSECYCCEAEVSFELDVNKERITATTECSQPDGFPPYKVRVNVPSGKLVFANDLREFIGINDSYNVNAVGGRIRTTQAYAAHDMVHISVGNTCPSIYQKGNTITMVTTKEDVKRKPGEGDYGKRRGGICTDLWWFCAIDYEVLRQKVNDDKKFERVVSDHYSTIVTVEPGMYEATSFEHLVRDESASYSLYSAIWGLEDKLAGRDRHDASKKFPKPSKAEAKQIKRRYTDSMTVRQH